MATCSTFQVCRSCSLHKGVADHGIGELLPSRHWRSLGWSQPAFFESSHKSLNGRFSCLQLTRAGFVAGHFWVEILQPKNLILADLEQSFDLIDRQVQTDGGHTVFYHQIEKPIAIDSFAIDFMPCPVPIPRCKIHGVRLVCPACRAARPVV